MLGTDVSEEPNSELSCAYNRANGIFDNADCGPRIAASGNPMATDDIVVHGP